jgi:hypothetical protein
LAVEAAILLTKTMPMAMAIAMAIAMAMPMAMPMTPLSGARAAGGMV